MARLCITGVWVEGGKEGKWTSLVLTRGRGDEDKWAAGLSGALCTFPLRLLCPSEDHGIVAQHIETMKVVKITTM
jgi:hypothetical protein